MKGPWRFLLPANFVCVDRIAGKTRSHRDQGGPDGTGVTREDVATVRCANSV